jgi:phosphate transport system permease protein
VSTTIPTPVSPPEPPAATPRSRWGEKIIEFALFCCGLLSILVTVAIAAVVLYGSFEFFFFENGRPLWTNAEGEWDLTPVGERVGYFFTGTQWSPGFTNPRYGIWPLLLGTLMIALIAALIAVPIGLSTAIYLSEYARPELRNYAKPILELLAGIPSVVFGFLAVTMITPVLAEIIPGLGQPFNQISGGIVVGIMIIPMVASLSEDALRAVPRSLRDGAYALGANKMETSLKVVVPAALSGITASFLLAISRAIGETMAVSLACGEMAQFTFDPREGLLTMTSFIVHTAKGDVQHGTTQFNSLFAVAGLLFFITLGMNVLAQRVLKRFRQVYQ